MNFQVKICAMACSPVNKMKCLSITYETIIPALGLSQQYCWYRCTELGKSAALASHRRIRLPKPKRLYRRFLKLGDVFPELSFREFLTSAEYAEVRHDA